MLVHCARQTKNFEEKINNLTNRLQQQVSDYILFFFFHFIIIIIFISIHFPSDVNNFRHANPNSMDVCLFRTIQFHIDSQEFFSALQTREYTCLETSTVDFLFLSPGTYTIWCKSLYFELSSHFLFKFNMDFLIILFWENKCGHLINAD